jgi:hypothetical protein
MPCLDPHLEGVRLGDDRVAEQVLGFGGEGDHVEATAEARELHSERHVGRSNGLAVLPDPRAQLG